MVWGSGSRWNYFRGFRRQWSGRDGFDPFIMSALCNSCLRTTSRSETKDKVADFSVFSVSLQRSEKVRATPSVLDRASPVYQVCSLTMQCNAWPGLLKFPGCSREIRTVKKCKDRCSISKRDFIIRLGHSCEHSCSLPLMRFQLSMFLFSSLSVYTPRH